MEYVRDNSVLVTDGGIPVLYAPLNYAVRYRAKSTPKCVSCGTLLPVEYDRVISEVATVHEELTLRVICPTCGKTTLVKCYWVAQKLQ